MERNMSKTVKNLRMQFKQNRGVIEELCKLMLESEAVSLDSDE